MGNTFTINYDFCLKKLFIYCLLIACKVVVVVVNLGIRYDYGMQNMVMKNTIPSCLSY